MIDDIFDTVLLIFRSPGFPSLCSLGLSASRLSFFDSFFHFIICFNYCLDVTEPSWALLGFGVATPMYSMEIIQLASLTTFPY